MYEVILSKDSKDYLNAMVMNHKAKARAIMQRLAELGPNLHRPHADIVRGKIRELRCGISTFEHRFLYFFDLRKIILTHGFLKKENSIPEREIERAERFFHIYFNHKQ
jgi:phage-related protein